jgi:hypothetical protein
LPALTITTCRISLASDPATDGVESVSPGRGVDYSTGDGLSSVNDPTNDNGNGYFLDAETAAPISNFVGIELRKQLTVGEDAKATRISRNGSMFNIREAV